jgi:hypothetical protein
MTPLNWALDAAALLLVLYAIRVLAQDPDEKYPQGRAKLGCWFFFLACILWSLASAPWVGGYWSALRLGLGVFLLVPAVAALIKPHGGRLVMGAIALIVSVLLAAPVVQELVGRWRTANSPVSELETRIDQLTEYESALVLAIEGWEEARVESRATVVAAGAADFSGLEGDPAALAALERMAELEQFLDLTRTRLEVVRTHMTQTGTELERIRQDELADRLDLPVLERYAPATPEELAPLLEYADKKRLQALYEREFE